MIFGDIVALAKAGWSFKDVKAALEYVETNPVTQETTPEEAKDAMQELKKQMEDVQTNESDPEVQLGAFAKLAKEE